MYVCIFYTACTAILQGFTGGSWRGDPLQDSSSNAGAE
uniref:Uncharacterized protein n=1 Tax=Arundo donax TaxID=35708 RepID=A0A0A8XPS2_ARUDO